MSRQNWIVLVGLVAWVLAASYFGAAYGDSAQVAKARELVEFACSHYANALSNYI
jgi:hypothetical protein